MVVCVTYKEIINKEAVNKISKIILQNYTLDLYLLSNILNQYYLVTYNYTKNSRLLIYSVSVIIVNHSIILLSNIVIFVCCYNYWLFNIIDKID